MDSLFGGSLHLSARLIQPVGWIFVHFRYIKGTLEITQHSYIYIGETVSYTATKKMLNARFT